MFWTALSRPLFLSTLSLRRATEHTDNGTNANLHFYPRSPCGERRQAQGLKIPPLRISIHALLAESDGRPRALKSRRCVFLSTLSLRRATLVQIIMSGYARISIHALLAESDQLYDTYAKVLRVFLSTLSLRRATDVLLSCLGRIIFLSTLSLRRATL